MDGFEKFFGIWFVICAALGLLTTGVFIWGFIKLVNHFTA